MANICLHAFISGRVQGVWYRQSTLDEAKSHNLTGWVRNLEDGRVEAMICGEEEAVRTMEEWLGRGSALAKVSKVETAEKNYEDSFEGFLILK